MEMPRCKGSWIGLAAALLGGTIGSGSLGCSYSCADTFTCEIEELSCPDDPADGDVPDGCGIWVSASLGNDGNAGSQGAPMATLAGALAQALSGPRSVYACAENFEESLDWPAGVSLHGGFSCAGLDWRYTGGSTRASIAPPANEIPLTLTGSAWAEPSMLTDLVIVADHATEPGGSSIAVLALPNAHAEIRRSRVLSGDGADGVAGDDGDHFGVAAKDGLSGNNGVAACTAMIGMGGDMRALDCDADSSFGGEGGNGGEMAANPGDGGGVAPASNPQGFGAGGGGEVPTAGLFCTPGLGGAAGTDGESGLGGTWPPRLTPAGYLGVWGGDGHQGRAGQGGGGGGASAGNMVCGAMPHGGAGGGSGGTGGCGGKGGRGGQPGGASIGLAALTAAIVLVDVEILAGNGGHGGRGGVPQQGAQGGLPGLGGAGLPVAGGPNPGCAGGAGGYGGDGGAAGGGLGGPSLAVAYGGTQSSGLSGSIHLSVGQPGLGGSGSDPDLSSSNGEMGKNGQVEALLP